MDLFINISNKFLINRKQFSITTSVTMTGCESRKVYKSIIILKQKKITYDVVEYVL